jgi:hypothetical protein
MRRARPQATDIELDLGRYELRCQGRRVKLEKKPMELLIFMVGMRTIATIKSRAYSPCCSDGKLRLSGWSEASAADSRVGLFF